MIPWIHFRTTLPSTGGDEGDEMADNYLPVQRYTGTGSTVQDDLSLGVNDEDTVKYLSDSAEITEGSTISVHDDDDTNYQNNSGNDAIVVLRLQNVQVGASTRHVKIYSHSVVDIAGGTLVFEIGQTDSVFFDANGDNLTTPPMRIQNGHFINVENVDDSRTGTNNLRVIGQANGNSIQSVVVERGSA